MEDEMGGSSSVGIESANNAVVAVVQFYTEMVHRLRKDLAEVGAAHEQTASAYSTLLRVSSRLLHEIDRHDEARVLVECGEYTTAIADLRRVIDELEGENVCKNG
jgi:hypothetical protein